MITPKEACQKHNVFYHHHDEFKKPPYTDDEDLCNAIIIVYSSQFGHWSLAINEDGSVVRPGDVVIAKMKNLLAKAVNTNIGDKVRKKSGKPFKSGLKVNTVSDIGAHPVLKDELAFSFVEDDSKVSCVQCEIANDDNS